MAVKKEAVAAEKEKQPFSIARIAAVIAVLAAVITFVLVLWPDTDCGFDAECFIERADNCEHAILRDTIGEGTIILYTAEDCVLTKSIEEFGDTEPAEVITFFENKKMTCEYEEGNFNAELIQGLSTGMGMCTGSLKDAVIELRIAQLSLETS